MEGDEKPTTSSKGKNDSEDSDSTMDMIQQFFTQKLSLGAPSFGGPKKKVIDDLSLDGLINHWKKKQFKNIITMVGAGISTSAGIPDFRSPGTGLYDNLQKYNLPYSMAIFDIDFFKTNPKPFFTLAKELYPGNFNPTPSHYFVRLLHEKGLLKRHYTQNIDTLERVAGIPVDKLVEAHGSFYTNHCISCKKSQNKEWVKECIFKDEVPKCPKCKNVVKPDIVFFGENLPDRFYNLPAKDFSTCDLLIVMGTSLEVYPFASLLEYADPTIPRLIINRTSVINMDDHSNTRDIEYLGDCDDAVWEICKGLDWEEDLKELIARENKCLEKTHAEVRSRKNSTSSTTDEDKPNIEEKNNLKEKNNKTDETVKKAD